jgi:hypothetical protein
MPEPSGGQQATVIAQHGKAAARESAECFLGRLTAGPLDRASDNAVSKPATR